jgi:hypothetical protein
MAIRLQGFDGKDERALERSLSRIRKCLKRPACPIPHDLTAGLRDVVSGSRPVVTLAFGGKKGACRDMMARTAGYRVQLCQKAFSALSDTRSRLTAILFHELVHVVRGKELDAEAFENGLFADEGARPPTREDWASFKDDGYRGWWVRVDPRTRRVTDYSDRLVLTFPRPTADRALRLQAVRPGAPPHPRRARPSARAARS